MLNSNLKHIYKPINAKTLVRAHPRPSDVPLPFFHSNKAFEEDTAQESEEMA